MRLHLNTLAVFCLFCLAQARPAAASSDGDWATTVHEPGYCATYGICGHREDGDPLSCASNTQAEPLEGPMLRKLQEVCPQLAAEVVDTAGAVCCSKEQLDVLQSQIQIASIFLVGCPACNHNFKHFFCLLTCSPDQATFTNVVSVQTANDTKADNAVAELDVFITPQLGGAFFNSCADVVYPAANVKAMKFVGGGASNYQEFVEFLGLVKDRRFPPTGSPFQMNFPPFDELPEDMDGLKGDMAPCGEGPLACSCGDCPTASGCEPPPPPPQPPAAGCPALYLPAPFTCMDVTMAAAYAVVLACIPAFVRFASGQQAAACSAERDALSEPLLADAAAATAAAAAADESGASGSGMAAGVQVEFCDYPASEQLLRRGFRALGLVCARRPWRTLGICAAACLLLALGTVRLHLVTEPQKLWVGASSQAAQEKAEYEAAFGPFYRITQLILSTTPAANSSHITPSGLPAVATDAHIRLLFAIQQAVDELEAGATNATLGDVCFKPFGDACATQSVLQYWGGSMATYDSPQRLSLQFCVDHWSTACRAQTGAPVDPKVVLGGFPTGSQAAATPAPIAYVNDSTAFVVTYPLDPSPDARAAAEAWEAAFIALAQGRLRDMAADTAGLRLSFSAERSIEDELQRESNADLATVAASYGLMFAYVALALGVVPRRAVSWRGLMIHGRASLALGGVTLVAAAVAGALGVCGWAGLGATLIIMEVIPFLALAVGVDNVFILTMAADRVGRGASPAERAAAALAAAGPSMALAAAAETAGFALGMLTSMPALQDFAACAAAAIAIDFLLQITAFPALLALDANRVQEERYDIAPWIKAPAPWTEEDEESEGRAAAAAALAVGGTPTTKSTFESSVHAVGTAGAHVYDDQGGSVGVTPALRWYMRCVHAPVLKVPWVKGVVVAAFAGMFIFSCAMLPRLQRGLDQGIALPQDSYLQQYYADVADLLRVGPPVSFVVKNLNLSDDAPDVRRVCSVAGCDDDSLLNRVATAARSPWKSYLASPAASWLDDFISWASPEIPQCCRLFPNGTHCPPPDQPPCSLDPAACEECAACFTPGAWPSFRPTEDDFEDRLPQFMAAKPSMQCAKGGVGAYSSALQRDDADPTGLAGLSGGIVSGSAFQTYYVPLSSQSDFIAALDGSRQLAATASQALGLDVFAYSIFHIFFEQYLTIGGEALAMLGSAAVAAFALCLVATGSPWAASIVLGTLSMLCVDLAGVMAVTGIQVNAVSLVNMAAAVGIGLEFCVHVVHAFMEESGDKERRTAAALENVGASVLSGITATKLVGVAVLAFAHTAIFQVYFFRFYLALVVLGAAHGLVFLPVILSTLGPEAYTHWTLSQVMSWQRRNSEAA